MNFLLNNFELMATVVMIFTQFLYEFKITDKKLLDARHWMRACFLIQAITFLMGYSISPYSRVVFQLMWVSLLLYYLLGLIFPYNANHPIVKKLEEEKRKRYEATVPSYIIKLNAIADKIFPRLFIILSIGVFIKIGVILYKGLLC